MEQKGKKQIWILFGMSVVIFIISMWAFVQGIHAQNTEGAAMEDLSSNQADQEKGGTSGGKLDIQALVNDVMEGVKFDTKLSKMEDGVAKSMVVLKSEDTKIELYMGDGTCADELLVVTVSDEKMLSGEIEAVQEHLLNMQQSFQDYLPKEAKKIEDAVILQAGNYIVACVSSQKDEAKKIIEEHLQ